MIGRGIIGKRADWRRNGLRHWKSINTKAHERVDLGQFVFIGSVKIYSVPSEIAPSPVRDGSLIKRRQKNPLRIEFVEFMDIIGRMPSGYPEVIPIEFHADTRNVAGRRLRIKREELVAEF